MPGLRQLVAGFSPQRLRFSLTVVSMGFVFYEMVQELVSVLLFGVPLSVSFHQFFVSICSSIADDM